MAASTRVSIALPAKFRAGDILAFHRRDPLEVAERVDAQTLRKGLAWEGRAACLTVEIDTCEARAELAVDGSTATCAEALEAMLGRMLGLTQPVGEFERLYAAHPQLGPLIAERTGLRVPLAATPFEALAWAVTGQQISVGAAVSLRRRLIQAAGVRHSGGLHCFPDAEHLAALSEAQLRVAGFSQAKARTLLALAAASLDGGLPLDDWSERMCVEEIREGLLQVRGIGPWTVNYALLRGFGWLDGSLHGDVAVRRSLQALLGRSERIGEEETRRWLAPFSPWRALIAAHLWARQSAGGN